jgi:hypothetical protein
MLNLILGLSRAMIPSMRLSRILSRFSLSAAIFDGGVASMIEETRELDQKHLPYVDPEQTART